MATPGSDAKNDFPGATPIRPRARPGVGAGGFAKSSLFSADGMATGPRRVRRRCCTACRPTSRSANRDVNPWAHDGSLSRRSRCLGLDALASARVDRKPACRRRRPICPNARCRGSRLPFLPARLRRRCLSAGAGSAHRGSGLAPAGLDAAGAARMLGALYVLEGSRLGARLLVPDLLAGGSARVRAATRYLRHGEGHRLWQSFLTHLESSQDVRACPGEAIAGARMAFALFIAGRPDAGLRARRVAAETADAD
jgi:hypothetical protein